MLDSTFRGAYSEILARQNLASFYSQTILIVFTLNEEQSTGSGSSSVDGNCKSFRATKAHESQISDNRAKRGMAIFIHRTS